MRPAVLAALSACTPGVAVLSADAPDSSAPASSAPAAAVERPAAPANVLVVVLDDLGIDKVRAYHPDAPGLAPQPTLDRLSAEGLRFTTAWAQPVCSPTRAALLTGLHARRLGIGDWLRLESSVELATEIDTLPELLRAAEPGLATAAFGKWHLGSDAGPSGLHHPNLQGFDHYAGWVFNVGLPFDYTRYRWVIDGEATLREGYLTTDTIDHALSWLQTATEPWLGYVATHAVHEPVHLPPADLHDRDDLDEATATVPELYGAMVQSVDTELGRLLDGIDPSVLARTHVIVVGDNGTFRQAITPPFDPLRGKGSLFEGGVRVPLWVLGPSVQPGTETDALAHVTDVVPTVLGLLGLQPPDDLDGVDLGPVLLDPDQASDHTFLYADRFAPSGVGPYTLQDNRAVRDLTHKLVADDLGGHELLFRLDGAVLDEALPIPPALWTAADAQAATRLGAELDRLRAELVLAVP